MQMLRQAGYGGRVVPVNPKGGTIFGYDSVTSIAAIDLPVDLAVIVIRPDDILDAPKEAADRGIKNLLILPGGFAEAGPFRWRATQCGAPEARSGARPHRRWPQLRGIIHLDPTWRFAATFLRDLPPGAAAGASNGLAFISQSGALAEEVIDKANARALPLTSVVSVGNDAREDRFGLAFEAATTHAASTYDMIMMIHVVPFMVDAAPVIVRLATLAASSRTPLLSSLMGTLPGKADWFAAMKRAGAPMFNDVEEMAEAAGLLARYPRLRDGARSDNLSDVRFRDRRGA
jgi:acyl-CoA synthetase (NDP forming)